MCKTTEVLRETHTHTQRDREFLLCSSSRISIDHCSPEEDLALPDHEWYVSRSEVVHKMRHTVKLMVP